ncbi:MAG: hypothetical protein ACLUOI_21050 [Eisenbergiella sp.]
MKAKNRKVKRMTAIFMAAAMSMTLLAGCGGKILTEEELSFCQTDIGTLTAPDHVKIVGLGESSHGASEYQQMKAEVFKALVKNNGCRTFVIEGDFGGDSGGRLYPWRGRNRAGGGGGAWIWISAQSVCRTGGLMRSYMRRRRKAGIFIFTGWICRYDNNKEYLFSVDESIPEPSEEYKEIFSRLTDDNRYVLIILCWSRHRLTPWPPEVMDERRRNHSCFGERDFALPENVQTVFMNPASLCQRNDYNSLRDGHMAEKVEWFVSQATAASFSLMDITGISVKVRFRAIPALARI